MSEKEHPYPDFVGEEEVLDLDRKLEFIANALVERTADFLFGAGMSTPSGLPTGRSLAELLLRRFFPEFSTDPPTQEKIRDLATCFPFEALMQAVELSYGDGRAGLTKELSSILAGNARISSTHKAFLSVLFWEGNEPLLNRLFTTNLDRLLEVTLADRGIAITDQNTKKLNDSVRAGLIPILYVHGTVASGRYQVTESDIYSQRFRSLHALLQSALTEADAFVFVGYSLSDPDTLQVYHRYRGDLKLRMEADKDTYVVSPVADKYTYALGKKLWQSRNAIWFPLNAEDFFTRLLFVLETRAGEDQRERIMKKYSLGATDDFQDLVERTSSLLMVSRPEAVRFLDETRLTTGLSQ